jgi:NAD+ kinase
MFLCTPRQKDPKARTRKNFAHDPPVAAPPRTLKGSQQLLMPMSKGDEVLESSRPRGTVPSRLGLVVHPTRSIDGPLRELRAWADLHDAQLVQIRRPYDQQRVADEGYARECDLLIAIGGDGTTLGAIRTGVIAERPVLAAACGSLGVLTSVPASQLVHALERFSGGDWVPRLLPALEIKREFGPELFALNDVAIVRAAAGQARLIAEVDGNLFARVAGDGFIVSTPIGSSAYALAAGGPLLEPDVDAFAITPLTVHGGFCPPLVVGATSIVRLDARHAESATRLELDGQAADGDIGQLTISFRPRVATVVSFPDQEPFLAVLRQRRIVIDSPRILAEDARG